MGNPNIKRLEQQVIDMINQRIIHPDYPKDEIYEVLDNIKDLCEMAQEALKI